ncbi:hypothetical protein Y032_0065g3615 [Ancylostoma ceylanicum]|uniref:Secreted protein n=1 Tax=Ancylostoma ceylanicum TaxID=53326 RepID=A0A016U158_9BILA|nr:hypothetical protein Y032_0065g3615 [Ancylostoma ceylanicum]
MTNTWSYACLLLIAVATSSALRSKRQFGLPMAGGISQILPNGGGGMAPLGGLLSNVGRLEQFNSGSQMSFDSLLGSISARQLMGGTFG